MRAWSGLEILTAVSVIGVMGIPAAWVLVVWVRHELERRRKLKAYVRYIRWFLEHGHKEDDYLN